MYNPRDDFLIAKQKFEARYHESWKKYRLYYIGEHWDTLVASVISEDASKPLINYIKPTIDQMVAMLGYTNPSIGVNPREKMDASIAELLESLLKYNIERDDILNEFNLSVLDLLIFGRGYPYIKWDSEKDNVDICSISPFNVFYHPSAYELKDSPYVHIRTLRTKEYVYEKYGVELDENGKDLFNPDKVGVEIIESWYVPNRQFERGRHIIWSTADEKPLLDEDNPYPEIGLPVTEMIFNRNTSGDIQSLARDMWGTQEVYMKTLGYILDNLRYTNNNKWGISGWDDAPDTMPTAPNYILKLPAGAQIIPLQPQMISSGWFSVLQMALATFPDISGVREVNLGTTSGGVTAATAIVALQEATKTRRDQIKNATIIPAIIEVSKKMAKLIVKYYTSDIIERITGVQNAVIEGDVPEFDITFSYSEALPQDKTTRLNLGMQLVNMQALDQEAFGTLIGDPLLAKLIMDTQERKAKQTEMAMQLQMAAAGAQQQQVPQQEEQQQGGQQIPPVAQNITGG